MSKLLVVLGATSLQGTSVVNHFLANEPTYCIRGTTRKPTSDAAATLREKGIEVVAADANDLSSLKAAFEGASAIFAYTDIAGCIQSPLVKETVEKGEAESFVKATKRLEVQQGKYIADAASEVEGLERLVWSNLTDVSRMSGGKYKSAVQFDSKAEVWGYMKGKKGLEGKVGAVVMGQFADNAVRLPGVFKVAKDEDGTYVYKSPSVGTTPIPFVDAKADTGAFVSALIRAPSGLQVLGVSEFMTSQEWLALWAKHNGVRARYENYPPEALLQQEGPFQEFGQALVDVFRFCEEFGYSGGDPDILSPNEFESKTGVKIPRTKMSDYIKREDWSSLL